MRAHAQSHLTLCDPIDCSPPGPSVHGDSPGKNTGVGCPFLLQGIFLTQGSSPRLLHREANSLPWWHLGGPEISVSISKRPWVVSPATGATDASYAHVAVRNAVTACAWLFSIPEAPTERDL